MKKLLFLLLFIPLVSFGQDYKEYLKKGDNFLKKGYYNKSIKTYKKALKLSKTVNEKANCYYKIGTAKNNIKDYKGAKEDFNMAIVILLWTEQDGPDLQPNQVRLIGYSYFGQGVSELNMKNYNQAITFFSEAIRIVPNYGDAFYKRALAKSFIGTNACTDAKIAKKLGYNNIEISPVELIESVCNPSVSANKLELKPTSFFVVDIPPVFPGCEKELFKLTKRKCMSKKITEFLNKTINRDVIYDYYDFTGLITIYVYFTISKEGYVFDIKSSDVQYPKKLRDECIRAVSLLPIFKPGMVKNEPIEVSYMLPIKLDIKGADKPPPAKSPPPPPPPPPPIDDSTKS